MADEDPIPMPRGSWTLHEAIATRWDEAGLDTVFRNEWPVAERLSTKYQPLNEGFAMPVPPGPYCVVEMSVPVVVGHMSGADAIQRENQFQSVLVQLSIHARGTAATATKPAESGKSICIRLAQQVADAFDPYNCPWEIYDDAMVQVWRGSDFDTREDDDMYVWVLQYTVMLDAEYLQA